MTWSNPLFVFQPDKTHLSNQNLNFRLFEEVFYIWFSDFVPTFCRCACMFKHQGHVTCPHWWWWLRGGGGVSNIWQPVWLNGKEEFVIFSANRKLRFYLSKYCFISKLFISCHIKRYYIIIHYENFQFIIYTNSLHPYYLHLNIENNAT